MPRRAFEGMLIPGKHAVWIQKGDAGSAPIAATVLEGQTVLVRPRAAPLGGLVRIEVSPATAAIFSS
jgi:hypothetical protein